jgi:hypothetical protein
MTLSTAKRAYLDTKRLLATEKNLESVARTLQTRGMKADDAQDLVEQVFRDNQAENRKRALFKMLGSGALLVIFVGIFLSSGTLFYIILPFAAISFLWGMVGYLTASGFVVPIRSAE